MKHKTQFPQSVNFTSPVLVLLLYCTYFRQTFFQGSLLSYQNCYNTWQMPYLYSTWKFDYYLLFKDIFTFQRLMLDSFLYIYIL